MLRLPGKWFSCLSSSWLIALEILTTLDVEVDYLRKHLSTFDTMVDLTLKIHILILPKTKNANSTLTQLVPKFGTSSISQRCDFESIESSN